MQDDHSDHSLDAQLENTLGVPCRAQFLADVASEQELQRFCRQALSQRRSVRVIGSGSNVLLPERVSGQVIRWRDSRPPSFEAPRSGRVTVTAMAGVNWHELVRRCVAAGAGGVENLALIPGTVGAAPIQNIGAYGAQLSDVVDAVRVYDLEADAFIDLSASDCQFGYRDSVFKRQPSWIVCSVRLMLAASSGRYAPTLAYGELAEELAARYSGRATIRQVMETVIAIRRRKLPSPRLMPNVGSFFKNPEVAGSQLAEFRSRWPDAPAYQVSTERLKVPAAWLIEQCGFKARASRQPRSVDVWYRQPLVLVNPARDKLNSVLELADDIANAVARTFGIELEREPELWAE